MIEIIPGILEQEFDEIVRKVALVAPHTPWVHIDISDSTMVKGGTFVDIPKLKPIITKYSKLSFEAHLMVASPEKYVKALSDAGFKRIVAHVECHDPRLFLEEAQYESVEVGLALDGATEVEHAEPFFETVDCVTVHTSEASVTPQPFLAESVEKIKLIREHYPQLPIEASGGIDGKTAPLVVDAGATRLVIADYLFKNEDTIARTIQKLTSIPSPVQSSD